MVPAGPQKLPHPLEDLRSIGVVLLCLLFHAPTLAQDSRDPGAPPIASIVERMERAQFVSSPRVPYQMLREHSLFGAKSSASDSRVTAEINFRPPSSKDYKIQTTSGSKRGEQVVRRVLDHEVQASTNGSQARTALTRANYDFAYAGEAVLEGKPCYVLTIKPKRKENDLILGQAWVDKQSFCIRHVVGEMAKTPSWWLKRVRVSLVFADFEGTWLEASVEAVADVRIVGSHTLTSRIVGYRGSDVVASTQIHKRTSNPRR